MISMSWKSIENMDLSLFCIMKNGMTVHVVHVQSTGLMRITNFFK